MEEWKKKLFTIGVDPEISWENVYQAQKNQIELNWKGKKKKSFQYFVTDNFFNVYAQVIVKAFPNNATERLTLNKKF